LCGIFMCDQPVAFGMWLHAVAVFVPVFHTDVMQAAGYVLQLLGVTFLKTIMWILDAVRASDLIEHRVKVSSSDWCVKWIDICVFMDKVTCWELLLFEHCSIVLLRWVNAGKSGHSRLILVCRIHRNTSKVQVRHQHCVV